MNDSIFDKALDSMIAEAAKRADKELGEQADCTDESIEFSEKHEKKMNRLFAKVRRRQKLVKFSKYSRRAACVLIAIPVGRWLLLYLLPEKELRLELFFLTNALVAILGIVATVNGRTSVAGVSEVNWGALAGVGGITIIGSAIGLVWRRVKKRIN